VDDRKVEFEGSVTSLSAAARDVLVKDHGWTIKAVQGPLYWTYDNQTLSELRQQMEEGAG
jgi:cellulose synthase/poly-beta-1,6-N-acetylglucosamine synthase-like glycosyltransferase